MNKTVFMSKLAAKLNTLPQSEINKSLAYYSEIIDDRMEDGMSEESAISDLGNLDKIAQETMLDATPLSQFIIPNRPLTKVDIFLLILCSPIFISLFALIILFYMVIWLVISALFLLDLSFVLVGVAGVVASIIDFSNNIPFNVIMFVCSLISIGIGRFIYPSIKIASREILKLTTFLLRNIKIKLMRRGIE